MKSFKGKTAVITGAASGIGRALAVSLAKQGANLALADVNVAGLRETANLIEGVQVSLHKVDVRSRAAVERFAQKVAAEHGGADLVFNNAGIAVRATLEEVTYEDFEFVMDVNFWGVVYGTKAFLPLLRKRPEAHIVNISSINGMVPFAYNGPYNASKYAVLGFSETLMQELRNTKIGVSVVHPGGIRTNIVRNSRGMNAQHAKMFDSIAMTSPEQAAKTILSGVRAKKERIYIGIDAKVMALAKRLWPAETVRLVGAASSGMVEGK